MPAPVFVQRILNSFPIVEYPEDVAAPSPDYPAAPSRPTLWVYGPGIGREKGSFDIDCLAAQAQAAFNGVELQVRDLQIADGAPGAGLPALHLPNGDLMGASAIPGWISKQSKGKGKQKLDDGYTVDEESKLHDEHLSIQIKTFTAVVESKLKPALLSHLFLTPKVFKSLTTPLYFPQTLSHGTPANPPAPALTRLVYSAYSRTFKLEVLAEVQRLSKNTGKLDLEELQRYGEEAIDLLGEKLDGNGSGWFFGTPEPTSLDALLYAHLHLIYILHAPHLDCPNPLRKRLEKHPQLLAWTKRLQKEYFRREKMI